MGNIYVDLGRFREAAQLFQQAIEIYPTHEIARYNLVYALMRMHQTTQALKEIDELLKLNPNTSMPRVLSSTGWATTTPRLNISGVLYTPPLDTGMPGSTWA